jgi:bifunctional non-homologous end joining protein LigD
VSLERYRQKRDFARTPEPSGNAAAPGREGDGRPQSGPPAEGRRFVMQRHRARQLHYDFRLEIGGVLASWAVPKGPSLDPRVRRAAFRVEDHPLDYFDFEGTIPAGEYGAGDVIVWDWGTFEAEAAPHPEAAPDPGQALRNGELKLILHGEKLKGRFTIVRTRGWPGSGSGRESWLLIKKRDEWAVPGWDTEAYPRSVKTGRTNDEVAAGNPVGATRRPPSEPKGVSGHGAASEAAGSMPAFVEPMTATLADRPFNDPDWLFEVKWDGYRVQAHVRDKRVALYTRRGHDAAEYFPELAGPATWLDARQAIVDGEVVALDAGGRPDFGLLQARRAGGRRAPENPAALAYIAFDLLYLDGRSLLDEPLEERKRLLRSILRDDGPIQYSIHVLGDGEAFFEAVAARNLEGVVAKRRTSRYEAGRRSTAWLKIKRRSEQDFVIGGWVPRENAQDDLGALVLGVFDGEALRPVGKVGTGFDARERRRLLERMAPLGRPDCPLRPVPREKGARWVEPRLVARVEFVEWTADGQLRAPSYKGLEIDADPLTVIRERPRHVGSAGSSGGAGERQSGAGVARAGAVGGPAAGASSSTHDGLPTSAADRASPEELAALEALPARGGLWSIGGRQLKLSNLNKVLWPGDGFTKRDLIRYYVSVAPVLLPHLRSRALTLQRYPDGIERAGFWQKQVPAHAPDWIGCWPAESSSGVTDYLLADSVATLAWLANEAAIDIHPSTFEIAAPLRPTWALVDIDPGERTEWGDVVLLARLYRTALDHLGLRGFPKLSGQRGIQIWIPVRPVYTFDQTRDWVAALSRAVAAPVSDLVSWKWEKARRDGLARLDYTQNAWNKTLVAPYSVRPVAGAPVSAPIAWDELDVPDIGPGRWTMATMPARLAERGDLFAPALSMQQELPAL